jgi:hypothetical protein
MAARRSKASGGTFMICCRKVEISITGFQDYALCSANVPLSGTEVPKLCGVHVEPYSDPAQFTVTTEPKFFGSKAAATNLESEFFPRSRRRVLTFVGNRSSVAQQRFTIDRNLRSSCRDEPSLHELRDDLAAAEDQQPRPC